MIRSVLTVMSGVALAQIVTLMALPVLTRIYDPSDFGAYQIFSSVLNILLIFSSLRYENGLLTARDGADYRHLLMLSLWLCGVTSMLTLVGMAALAIIHPAAGAALGVVFWLLPPALLVAGWLQALTFVPARDRDYPLSAKTKVIQAAGSAGASIILGLASSGTIGIIGGDMLGRALAVARILYGGVRRSLCWLTWAEACATLWKNRSLPYFLLPGALLSSLVPAMIPFVFARSFGLEIAGQYALVQRFAFMPVGVLAAALSQVMSGNLAQLLREHPDQAHAMFRRSMSVLIALSLVLGAAIWFVAPTVIRLMFDERWAVAGDLCAVSAPLLMASFVAAPVTSVLVIAGRAKAQLGWEIGRFVVLVLLFAVLVSVPGLGPVPMMAVFSIVASLTYVAFLILAEQSLLKMGSSNNE